MLVGGPLEYEFANKILVKNIITDVSHDVFEGVIFLKIRWVGFFEVWCFLIPDFRSWSDLKHSGVGVKIYNWMFWQCFDLIYSVISRLSFCSASLSQTEKDCRRTGKPKVSKVWRLRFVNSKVYSKSWIHLILHLKSF